MSDPWYRFAPSEERLAQGDLVFDCPLLNWSTAGPLVTDAVTEDRLGQLATGIRADVVVVTKACDMEQDHVSNVVLCPHLGLDEHRTLWEGFMRAKGQNPTPKAWRNYCDDIRGK